MSKFSFKPFFKKIVMKKSNANDEFLDDLRKNGAQIGTDVYIYDLSKTLIDRISPWLLKIGDHVRITEGVKILTHDYSWSVLKRYRSETISPGSILGAQSAVEIGNCVFIGMNSIITRGVKIGDHVIIGAGSVVTKDCPSDGVYAGNPARRIMSLEEYHQKRSRLQFSEAKDIAIRYKERFSSDPPKEVFFEYFMLFSSREDAQKNSRFKRQMELLGNYEDCVGYMDNHKPMFNSYEEFLKACYKQD